jgi:hypothetical protein
MQMRTRLWIGLLAVVAGTAIYYAFRPGDVAMFDGAQEPSADTAQRPAQADRSLMSAPDSQNRMASAAEMTISGRVVDQNRNPVPGAEIYIGDERHEAGPDGKFTKLKMPESRGDRTITIGAGEYYTTAVLEPGASGAAARGSHVRTVDLHPGHNELGSIVLRKSGAIDGFVVDDRGYAVVGATVSLPGFQRSRSAVRTDEGGHFLLKQIPPGNMTLTIRLRDREVESNSMQVDAGKTTHLPAVVLPRTPEERALRGRLVNAADGEPVPGAQIVPEKDVLDAGNNRPVYSNEKGYFTISGVVDVRKPFTFDAEAHGFPKKTFGPVAAETQNGIFALDGGPRFELMVTNALSGQPIEEFGVWSCPPLATNPRDLAPPVMKHPGGVARLFASAPRRTRVVVDAPGFPLFEGYVDYSKSTPDIRIPPGSKVRVRVLNGSAPAAGILVSICYVRLPKGTILGAFVRYPNVAEGGAYEFRVDKDGVDLGTRVPEIRARDVDRERRTDARGICEFESIPPGDFVVVMKDRLGGESVSESFTVKMGQPAEVQALITIPGIVRGTVDPGLADNVTIVAKRADGLDPTFRKSGAVRPDGTFTIDGLPPGRYLAAPQFGGDASAPDFEGAAAVSFQIASGGTTEIAMSLASDGRATIEGAITFVGYRPGRLQLKWFRETPEPRREGIPVVPAENGDFVLKSVPPGKIKIKLVSDLDIIAEFGPLDVLPNKSVQFNPSVSLGSLRIRVDGVEADGAHVNIQIEGTPFVVSKKVPPGGDIVVPAPPGKAIVSTTAGGKIRTATGMVSSGAETFVEL